MRQWLLAGVIAFANLATGVGATPPAPDPRPSVTALANGLMLDWRAPPAQIVPRASGTFAVTMAGYSSIDRPGAPQLPFASILIALPPDADPVVRVLLTEEDDQALPGPLSLAPRPEGAQRDASGEIVGGAFAPAAVTLAIPLEPVEIEEIGIARGVRLARLTFYPVLPIDQAATQTVGLRVITHLRAAVDFRSAFGAPRATSSDPLVNAVRAAVVNPDQVQPIPRSAPLAAGAQLSKIQNPGGAGNTRTAVEVSVPGLTAITYEALIAIGFPVYSADPRFLHLMRAGIDIAAQWEGDADAAFEPGERLLFYAEPRFSRYTTNDVYFLSIDTSTPGLRMSTRSAAPGSAPVRPSWVEADAETNILYVPDRLFGPMPAGRDGDRYMWDDLTCFKQTGPACTGHPAATYSIQLPAVDTAQPAVLSVWLLGYTDIPALQPDHRVDVSINGVGVGRVEWNGKQAITATLSISPGILRSAANTVGLTLPGMPGVSVEGVWLDAFSINYARSQQPAEASVRFGTTPRSSAPAAPAPALPYTIYLPSVMNRFTAPAVYRAALSAPGPYRAYDVSDADRPVRLTDYATSGNLVSIADASTTNRYFVTSGAAILSPVNLRLASLLQTSDAFTGADYVVISPAGFAPALASLVGLRQSQGLSVAVENVQAIYDAYGDGRPEPQAIRAYLAHAYATWSLRPSYVLLAGDGTSDPKRYRSITLPTIIPPYLADVDPWAGETAADNRFVTVDGDDVLPDIAIGRLPVSTLTETQVVVNKIVQYETRPFPGGWNGKTLFVTDDPDSAGDFAAESDSLISAYITPPFTAQRIYFAPPTTTVTSTYQSIVNQWNAGPGLIIYTGHASQHQWAAERLFHLDDAPRLVNGPRLPVVLEMTCFTGSFHNPTFSTLDEGLVRQSTGGAVAVWGPTGLGVGTGHSELAEGFLRSVYTEHKTDLGLATFSGKLTLVTNQPAHVDLVDTFTLLGDPATHIDITLVPWSHFIHLPLIRR